MLLVPQMLPMTILLRRMNQWRKRPRLICRRFHVLRPRHSRLQRHPDLAEVPLSRDRLHPTRKSSMHTWRKGVIPRLCRDCGPAKEPTAQTHPMTSQSHVEQNSQKLWEHQSTILSVNLLQARRKEKCKQMWLLWIKRGRVWWSGVYWLSAPAALLRAHAISSCNNQKDHKAF